MLQFGGGKKVVSTAYRNSFNALKNVRYVSSGVFPLTFKVHKLKLENVNESISKKITRKFLSSHEVAFQPIEKKAYFTKLQRKKCFCIHRSHDVKTEKKPV